MNDNELMHYGILGMKWGIRRYQNPDGTLTAAGKRRYNSDGTLTDKGKRQLARIEKKTQKKLAKSTKYNNMIMEARKKNRGKIEAKYNKKIKYWQEGIDTYKPYASIGMKSKNGKTLFTAKEINDMIKVFENKRKALKTRRDDKLKDFDDGTKYIKQGQDRYDAIIKNYGDAKISEIKNSGYNKSYDYRRAVAAYTNQVISDVLSAQSGTKLTYAGESARTDTSYDKK